MTLIYLPLRLVDLLREPEESRTGLVRLGHAGHVDRLRMVRDHPLHELDVRYRIEGAPAGIVI